MPYHNEAQSSCMPPLQMKYRGTHMGNLLIGNDTTFVKASCLITQEMRLNYLQTFDISHILMGNKMVNHSDVVGASTHTWLQ